MISIKLKFETRIESTKYHKYYAMRFLSMQENTKYYSIDMTRGSRYGIAFLHISFFLDSNIPNIIVCLLLNPILHKFHILVNQNRPSTLPLIVPVKRIILKL